MKTKEKPTSKVLYLNPDTDEAAEGISYEKGLEFEKEFASFMKQELGWSKVRVGAHLSGKDNAKGANIDVIGEKIDEVGIRYRKSARKWFYSAGFCTVLAGVWNFMEIGRHGYWFFLGTMLSLLPAIAYLIFAELNHKRNAWVECKNLKSKANINHISKMIREIEDHKRTKDDKYKFTEFYFASANGYVENALKLAVENKIICYVKNGDSFEEVKYWQ